MADSAGMARRSWPGARHLIDLPKGYHAAARGRACVRERRYCRRVPPTGGVIALRKVEEMALRQLGVGEAEHSRSARRIRTRPALAPGDTKAQLRQHVAAQGGSR
jgi:hypothetical protein